MSAPLTELHFEFLAWCEVNHMPEEGDASELLGLPSLSAEQRDWLTDFLTRWDNEISGQEYPDARTAEDWKTHAE
jgi:hypothetical protein